MTVKKLLLWASVAILPLGAEAGDLRAGHRPGQIEPSAGQWRTWVISSGEDYRVPAPPGPAQTRAELRELENLTDQTDDEVRRKIRFWDAGDPAYRWIDLLSARALAGTPTTAYSHRVFTYVALAMYDATIATWEGTSTGGPGPAS